MKEISSSTTLTELAFIVCTALDRCGTQAILSGGAAAAYYAPNVVASHDLDFILTFGGGAEASLALQELGFEVRPERHYAHPKTLFTLEFPPGPLMVGDAVISSWETVRREGNLLHIITPTDSVRDRLAAYLHWNDLGSLESALHVARAERESIDIDLIESWCRQEGGERKFAVFRSQLI